MDCISLRPTSFVVYTFVIIAAIIRRCQGDHVSPVDYSESESLGSFISRADFVSPVTGRVSDCCGLSCVWRRGVVGTENACLPSSSSLLNCPPGSYFSPCFSGRGSSVKLSEQVVLPPDDTDDTQVSLDEVRSTATGAGKDEDAEGS